MTKLCPSPFIAPWLAVFEWKALGLKGRNKNSQKNLSINYPKNPDMSQERDFPYNPILGSGMDS